jgi:large subunit ribosomal protein L15
MFTLNNLSLPKGANRKIKRIGRGQGSGWGKQAGKGHKGQKARSGGGVRVGFEGGQMPLYMRLPKRGFSNAVHKKEFAIINLELLENKFDTEEITRETLILKGLLKGRNKSLPIKVIGNFELTKKLTFKEEMKFSEGAKKIILSKGGKIS